MEVRGVGVENTVIMPFKADKTKAQKIAAQEDSKHSHCVLEDDSGSEVNYHPPGPGERSSDEDEDSGKVGKLQQELQLKNWQIKNLMKELRKGESAQSEWLKREADWQRRESELVKKNENLEKRLKNFTSLSEIKAEDSPEALMKKIQDLEQTLRQSRLAHESTRTKIVALEKVVNQLLQANANDDASVLAALRRPSPYCSPLPVMRRFVKESDGEDEGEEDTLSDEEKDDRLIALKAWAAEHRVVDELERLLESTGEVDSVTSECLVLTAVKGNFVEAASEIIARGADVNVTDEFCQTALHVAAENGLVDFARMLLQKGADPASTDEQGITPLHLAAESGDTKMIEVLLDSGIIADLFDMQKCTPLMLAAETGSVEAVQTLIDKASPDVNCQNADSKTALLLAVSAGHVEVARSLMNAAADFEIADSEGLSPLHIACERGDTAMIDLLLMYGADDQAKTRRGQSPVSMADEDTKQHLKLTLGSFRLVQSKSLDEPEGSDLIKSKSL